jgi:uroporphyrinogen-III synthase
LQPVVKKATIQVPAKKKIVVKKVVAKASVAKKPTPVAKKAKKESAPVIVKAPVAAKNTAPKAELPSTSTEKFVKVGVKTKKQLVVVAPQPVIEVSNYPKHKVKTILISQPKPENDKNPYYELSKKYNLIETFRQFIKIEGIPVKDFRSQRIDILEHKAVILTSRMSVDHYFRMCNEMRVTVPESMKYFCINEATAYYLQKYIQYRKRKIFFGHQTIQDLVDVIRKNREEKFLLPAADVHKEQICEFLDAINIKYTKAVLYRTVSADLSDIKNLNDYDVLAFFTPAGINSLKQNFPNFKQGNTRIACFGAAAANTLKKHGYRLDIYAPNPKNPSMSGALDDYIKEANKR